MDGNFSSCVNILKTCVGLILTNISLFGFFTGMIMLVKIQMWSLSLGSDLMEEVWVAVLFFSCIISFNFEIILSLEMMKETVSLLQILKLDCYRRFSQ